ncbi:hypothetical protein [Paraburkholderia caffeinilytica]|uniref:hypothetical protein n=1 Tax=Paraburkholderia caffeinilytica TaxID=1761016 RepID=UPI003DA02375
MNNTRYLVVLCALTALLTGCGKPPARETTSSTSIWAGVSTPVAVGEGAPHGATGKPRHNYVFDGGHGKYGYPQPISEDDAQQGRLSGALLLVRYMGQHGGMHTFQVDADENFSELTRIECATPCDSVKEDSISDGHVVHSETMALVEGTVLAAMFEDAGNEVLTPYMATTDSGSPGHQFSAVTDRDGGAGEIGNSDD